MSFVFRRPDKYTRHVITSLSLLGGFAPIRVCFFLSLFFFYLQPSILPGERHVDGISHNLSSKTQYLLYSPNTTDPKDTLWISFGLEWDKQKPQHSLPTAQQDSGSLTGGTNSRRPVRQRGRTRAQEAGQATGQVQ